jgi:hypothetical protein
MSTFACATFMNVGAGSARHASDFDATVALHPTVAEELVLLK